MRFQDLGKADLFPLPPPLTDEEQAAALEAYRALFDPQEAEKDYRSLIEIGGVSWEELMQKFDEIDQPYQQL
jgi:hypothetical protein